MDWRTLFVLWRESSKWIENRVFAQLDEGYRRSYSMRFFQKTQVYLLYSWVVYAHDSFFAPDEGVLYFGGFMDITKYIVLLLI